MPNRYDPTDPRYQDRFQAAVELLKLWRSLVQPDADGVNRIHLHPSQTHTLNQLVKWTDGFIHHPETELIGRQ